MAGFTVFYAWQSDLPRNIAKNFIREAAEEAVSALAMDLQDSPRLDQDTEGVSGIPIIGDTIMRKIEGASAFIADVSLVSRLIDESKSEKLSPNPNVLLELGYAWARIGWQRLILVMNKINGDQEQLPFDLRHRRFPYGFMIAANGTGRAAEKEKLSDYVEMALRSIVNEEHQRVSDIIRKLDGYCMYVMRKYSTSSHIWETVADSNKLAGQHDLAILRLLQHDVLELTPFTGNETGFAYTWTYLGRLCLRRLSLPEPPPVHTFDVDSPPPTVITDFSYYDNVSPSDTADERNAPNTTG